MNFMDLLFLLLFVTSLAVGFFQGMIRFAVLLVALYLSLVLSSLYYFSVGNWLADKFNSQVYVGQYIAFGVLLLLSFILLAVAGLYTFRYAHLPGGLRYLDHIGGMILGMLLGVFLLGTFAALLYNLLIIRGARNIDFPVMRWLGSSVETSFLVNYFATHLLGQIYALLDPILPQGAAMIFTGVTK